MFYARCKKDRYIKKGSKTIDIPAFIKGKIYKFEANTFYNEYFGLGNYTAKNELGTYSLLSKSHFDEYFERI